MKIEFSSHIFSIHLKICNEKQLALLQPHVNSIKIQHFKRVFISIYFSQIQLKNNSYDEIIKNVELTSQILHVRYSRFTIIPKEIRVYGICIIFVSWTCSSAELISYHSNLTPDFSTQMSNLINVCPKKQIALLKVSLNHLGLTHIPSVLNSSLSQLSEPRLK